MPNTINRYHLAAWMPLKHNTDGSLDLHIQAAPRGATPHTKGDLVQALAGLPG